MLGTMDQSYLLRIVEALAAQQGAALVALADEMQQRSLSFDAALADLASLLMRMALSQAVPEALDEDVPERPRIVALAGTLDPELVQLYYQIAVQGREDLPLAPDEHSGFLMTLLRMLAFRPEGGGPALAVPAAVRTAQAAKPAAASAAVATPPAARAPAPAVAADWPALVQQLPVAGAARELARNAELRGRENNSFQLTVPKSKAYLAERSYQEKLKAALEQHLGAAVRIEVTVGEVSGATAAAIEAGERNARQAEAARAVQSDGFVRDLVNMFDGKVIDSTIRQTQK
jgi:DNA polymerase-3 subunit gamma/tau